MLLRKSASEVPTIASADIEKSAHEAFRQYRSSHPFAALEDGGHIVLRYGDVSRLSGNARLQATETAVPTQGGITGGTLFDIFQHGMLTANGGVHERRRSAMSRTVAGLAVTQFRSHVRRAAETLIEEHFKTGILELRDDYAGKLPLLALAGMLGIPESEMPAFTQDVLEMNEFFRPHATGSAIARAGWAADRLRNYLRVLLARKQAGQGDDFLSLYLAQVDADGDLSEVECLMQIVQFIIGGTESLQTAIVAQTANLLAHPEQWNAVRDDPALVSAAVSESLRFEPGIAGLVRASAKEISIDGRTLPPGQLVILSLMSALRDEDVFERADSFDIFRPGLSRSQLAFGGGAHRCVADALGRAELEEGLIAITERIPNLRPTLAPVFQGHLFVRRTTRCWVTW